jgi:hypothetical protein
VTPQNNQIIPVSDGFLLTLGARVIACSNAKQLSRRVYREFRNYREETAEGAVLGGPRSQPSPPESLTKLAELATTTELAPTAPVSVPMPHTQELAPPETDAVMELDPMAVQHFNLERLAAEFTRPGSDMDNELFMESLQKYCPDITGEEANNAVLAAQGLDHMILTEE